MSRRGSLRAASYRFGSVSETSPIMPQTNTLASGNSINAQNRPVPLVTKSSGSLVTPAWTRAVSGSGGTR